MLKLNRERTDIVFSLLSGVFVLALSLALGFFLPKYISIEAYAQYKTYILYAGFVGFFHFGFINGVYLKYGHYDYDDLPRETFRKYTGFLVLSQLAVQAVLMILLICILKADAFRSPFFFVILNIPLININCYFNLINQFTKRFRLDALIQLIQNILLLAGIVLLLLCKSDNYIHYLTAVTAANLSALLISAFKCRELIFGGVSGGSLRRDIAHRISHGFFIMISEYMGLVVVGIDSIIVNIFLSAREFSVYSFAVSVVSVLFQLTGIVSKFIFPYLKRKDPKDFPRLYESSKLCLVVFSAAAAGVSLFMEVIISALLPKYSDSIIIIKLLGITVVFKGAQELLCGNFFKALSIERDFAKTNTVAIVFALVSDIAAFAVFRSMISVAAASIVSFVLWFFVSDCILRKKMNIRSFKGNIILICIVAAYFHCASMSTLMGIVVYYLILAAAAVYALRLYKGEKC